MPGSRPRVLIADDHHMVAEMSSKLLETEFTVVGTVQNGRAMVVQKLTMREVPTAQRSASARLENKSLGIIQ